MEDNENYQIGRDSYRSSYLGRTAKYTTLAATLCMGTTLYAGDGTNEQGFVPPPRDPAQPPAPPRSVSSAESVLGCCCCPIQPMSRTESKKPPQPPVLVTKIRDERIPGN